MRFLILFLLLSTAIFAQKIPLPEHPRPDFERENWINLNGNWNFEFDQNDVGEQQTWFDGKKTFSKTINVPFPWGSPLSGVNDEADYAWYQRTINVPADWNNKRIFVTIGASDWKTTVWLDGILLGSHQGGYTPFSFELKNVKFGTNQNLVVKVDDKRRDFTLYGKQGYGNARGLWQTVYLEARGQNYIDYVHFTPTLGEFDAVNINMSLGAAATQYLPMKITIKGPEDTIIGETSINEGQKEFDLDITLPNSRRWTLEDPYLYEVTIQVADDQVKSYFGLREISTVNLPNTNYKYVSLNGKPIYLQLTLDQSYHPEGFYTFPSDEFMKNEILIARNLGLNGIRTHIKVDIPRKLYWADKLGVLVMSDLPNSWGEPDKLMQAEAEYTLREMIKRDYNHPAIFSWIVFNETWGLRSKKEIDGKTQNIYTPETQKWVASMYRQAKSLDKTRLVEDNSICCGAGHTETDINSWHEYLPGWEWEEKMKEIDKKTFVGSPFHYEKGYVQTDVPNINSECGNVWGYEGSTGDVDWSYDYHRMMNTFRKYPIMAGWLYTEHHDVINEWNGYVRFDRTEKETGVGDIVKGMSVKDFHADFYISTGNEICKTVKPSEVVSVPLWASFMTDRTDVGTELTLKATLYGYDAIGQEKIYGSTEMKVPYKAWLQQALEPLRIKMPNEKAVVTMALELLDNTGNVLQHNFMNFIVEAPTPPEIVLENGKKALLISKVANELSASKWSLKQWDILNGLKENGAGSGFFEYRFQLPKTSLAKLKNVSFIAEVSAKELFVKDMDKKIEGNPDYMLGSVVAPSQNPNAYPMTDITKFPSTVMVFANGTLSGRFDLPDDPADHRGVLSWHSQLQDRKLREAGSYGYRLAANLNAEAIAKAKETGEVVIRLEVPEAQAGGLAIYGDKFGRYPINPSLVLITE